MHVFFSGISGSAIGPLALMAKQAGYTVSGSDNQESQYTDYLRSKGITDIIIGQSTEAIASLHAKNPIDWYVYSSAISIENPDHPELVFARQNDIRMSKRDELINKLLQDSGQKLIAIAGTHGKTTTTAMCIWAFKQLGVPLSYSVGAKLSFGDMGEFDPDAEYFVYEADEYDRNFLAFDPEVSLITGIDWDHPDIYPTREEYYDAFREFIAKSTYTISHPEDLKRLSLTPSWEIFSPDAKIDKNAIHLTGEVNRKNASLVVQAVSELVKNEYPHVISIVNDFPGISRRFEQVAPNIYTDYAHTPEKIRGAIQIAHEALDKLQTARVLDVDGVRGEAENLSEAYQAYDERRSQASTKQSAAIHEPGVVIVYEGLHNTRQHFIVEDLKELFSPSKALYIVPSYLAREDKSLELLTPEKLCEIAQQPTVRTPSELNDTLKTAIQKHVDDGDLVLCLSAGGGGSLDEWLRETFGSRSED